jgi:hypothetical protein
MSACRPARHTATIRRAALSPARADRIDHPVDLRFLAVDGGMVPGGGPFMESSVPVEESAVPANGALQRSYRRRR